MKRYFWVFAAVVFVISVSRPVFASSGCGGNAGRYTPTTSTAGTSSTPQAPTAGTAQGAGMARGLPR